jgi:hypothetical protein
MGADSVQRCTTWLTRQWAPQSDFCPACASTTNTEHWHRFTHGPSSSVIAPTDPALTRRRPDRRDPRRRACARALRRTNAAPAGAIRDQRRDSPNDRHPHQSLRSEPLSARPAGLGATAYPPPVTADGRRLRPKKFPRFRRRFALRRSAVQAMGPPRF